jgi:cytidylate kinase
MSSSLVLAFSGYRGAGKTTVSTAVAQALGMPRVSFGDEVRRLARQISSDSSTENLQSVGASVVEAEPLEFCKKVLRQATHWEPGSGLVIDGLRHLAIVTILRVLVRPSRLLVIYIDVPREERARRLVERDLTDVQPVDHSVEADLPDLFRIADITLTANTSVDQALAAIAAASANCGSALRSNQRDRCVSLAKEQP